jgi:cytochrome c peroxidase
MRRIGYIFGLIVVYVFCCGGDYSTTPYPFEPLKFFPKMPASSENPITIEGAKLGRYLFYDPVLSADSNLSCASCHKQQYAFCDGTNQFSKGKNGTLTKRNSMALFNLAWYPAFFWDGKVQSIEAQVSHPLTSAEEMNMEFVVAIARLNNSPRYKKMFSDAFEKNIIDSTEIVYAIAQFLRTLVSNKSKYDRVIGGNGHFSREEYSGYVLVNDQTKGDCLHCHTTDGNALGTTLKFSNNGLDGIMHAEDYKDKGRGAVTAKTSDNGKFIIPSLRNVAVTAPYMHDGRFKSLEEVMNFYSNGVKVCANIDSKMEFAHYGGAHLSAEEQQNIIAFLKTMTDSVFISNAEYENPFIKE